VLVTDMTILRQCGRAGCDPGACCLKSGNSLGDLRFGARWNSAGPLRDCADLDL